MIENPKSAQIKKAAALQQKKQRLLTGRFIVEGPHAVEEALRFQPAGVRVIYTTHAGRSRFENLDRDADAAGVRIEMVSEQVLAALSDTVTPQGVVAVVDIQNPSVAETVTGAKLVAVLIDVRDPGNAGAVLRAADAAGADAVIFAGESIDPWHPKVVRATTGSLFHLPISYERDSVQVLDTLTAAGLLTIAADIRGTDLQPVDPILSQRTAWIFGNEAHGLKSEERERCDHVRKLPIYGQAESLNLATAAAVCLYTSAFQQQAGA
ncbi:TrmH family RNA methyltransferase [Canibacter zhoujuaniae]|uniref:TrmH family RNA methyltransferase n=1 Tax=Canibacter zhoujuaniae TaxID=2708343 RepID=UPI00142496D4|nr:RNA methyltransferase [Canibacter zhoujuaniae]